MPVPSVILACARDAGQICNEVRNLAFGPSVQVIDDRARVDTLQLPNTWDNCIILIPFSPAALTDLALGSYVRLAIARHLPLLLVVPERDRFSPSLLAATALEGIDHLNYKWLVPDAGASILEAVRWVLGIDARNRERKVFISYRRADGEAVANAICDHLWSQRCAAFLDTLDIGGTEPVQEVIRKELGDKDFVLFIDSPRAPESNWVLEELLFALAHRIPVASVLLDAPIRHVSMLGPTAAMDWNPNDPERLDKVLRLVNRGIGLRDSLEARVSRILDLAPARGLQCVVDPLDRRRIQLKRGDDVVLRLEYEPGPLTLERLHRLYQWYSQPPGAGQAVFVGGDDPLLPPTRAAIDWARNAIPLDVMTVRDIFSLIARI